MYLYFNLIVNVSIDAKNWKIVVLNVMPNLLFKAVIVTYYFKSQIQVAEISFLL